MGDMSFGKPKWQYPPTTATLIGNWIPAMDLYHQIDSQIKLLAYLAHGRTMGMSANEMVQCDQSN
jgi:hypothetical protein